MNFKNSMILIAVFMLSACFAISQNYQFDPNSLPKEFGTSGAGTEFWMTFHTGVQVPTEDNDTRIYIVSEHNTKVTISVRRDDYEETFDIKANELTEVTLPEGLGVAHLKSRHEPLVIDIAYGAGIHVVSEKPIIVYGMLRFYQSSDGYLAMPINTLGKKYTASTFQDYSDHSITFMPPYITVVGAYDDTQVFVTVGGLPGTETTNGKNPSESAKYTIHAGDVAIIATENRLDDLSGTIVEATKPIAAFAGNMDAEVPVGDCCGDYLIDQLTPMESWGKFYLVIPPKDEEMNSLISVFAREDDTDIWINGNQVANIAKAGGDTLHHAWTRIMYNTPEPEPMLVYSDKQIAVSQFGYSKQHGDEEGYHPFLINLTPIEQFSNELEFLIPGNPDKSDNFTVNMLQFIYPGEADGSIPDDITVTYNYKGEWTTRELNKLAQSRGTQLPNQINGKTYHYYEIPFKDFGYYIIKSNDNIGGALWGYNSYSSYGTESWQSAKILYSDDKMAPGAYFTKQANGNIDNGQFEDRPSGSDDRTEINMIYFIEEDSFNYTFNVEEFQVGFPKPIDFTLTVDDIYEDARAVVLASDRAGNDTVFVFEYFTDNVRVNPDSYDFDLVKLTEAKSYDFWLVNDSEGEVLIVNNLRFGNGDQGFVILNLNGEEFDFPLDPINPKDSIQIRIRQTAGELGEKDDSLVVVSQKLTQSVLHVKALVSSPIIESSDVDFDEVSIGLERVKKLSFHNSGLYPMIMTGFDGPMDKDVFVMEDHGISEENPFTLEPNKFKNIFITFKPGEEAEYKDSIKVLSDAQSGDDTVILTGTGITSVLDEIEDGIINIFPNPTNGIINISSNDGSYLMNEIIITDLQGKVIISKSNIKNNTETIDLRAFTSGNYIIEIRTNKGTMTTSLQLKK
jgi:hypothetical protein